MHCYSHKSIDGLCIGWTLAGLAPMKAERMLMGFSERRVGSRHVRRVDRQCSNLADTGANETNLRCRSTTLQHQRETIIGFKYHVYMLMETPMYYFECQHLKMRAL